MRLAKYGDMRRKRKENRRGEKGGNCTEKKERKNILHIYKTKLVICINKFSNLPTLWEKLNSRSRSTQHSALCVLCYTRGGLFLYSIFYHITYDIPLSSRASMTYHPTSDSVCGFCKELKKKARETEEMSTSTERSVAYLPLIVRNCVGYILPCWF